MRTVDGDYRNDPDAHAYQRAVEELERERDEARRERDEAGEERDALAVALRHLERLASRIPADDPTEARYRSDLRWGVAEARGALAAHDERSK